MTSVQPMQQSYVNPQRNVKSKSLGFESPLQQSKHYLYEPNDHDVISNINHLSEEHNIHDITFIVGSNDNIKEFKCIRALFAAQSTIFKFMLYGNFKESKNNKIIIKDVNPDAFDYICKIFYAAKPKLTTNIAVDVLYICYKYFLKNIQNDIIQYIISSQDVKLCATFSKYQNIRLHQLNFQYSALEFFNNVFIQFIQNQSLESIHNMLLNKNGYVSITQAKYMIKTKIMNYEIRYEMSKLFCIGYLKNINHGNNFSQQWQKLFKTHFKHLINFQKLCPQVLFDEIKRDNILSSDELIECIDHGKIKFENGFRSNKWMLTDYHINNENKSRERLFEIKRGDKVYVCVDYKWLWIEMQIKDIQNDIYAIFNNCKKIHINDIDLIKRIDINQ